MADKYHAAQEDNSQDQYNQQYLQSNNRCSSDMSTVIIFEVYLKLCSTEEKSQWQPDAFAVNV